MILTDPEGNEHDLDYVVLVAPSGAEYLVIQPKPVPITLEVLVPRVADALRFLGIAEDGQ